jgi:hypothetical protein
LDRWIGKHRWLVLILIIFTVAIPICAAIIAQNHFNDRSTNVLVSSLVGWPSFQPHTSNELIAIGVGLSALAVFGIPAVLGAVITILLEKG